MGRSQSKPAPTHFKTMVQSDVPQGRNGKHKHVVTIILEDLVRLTPGAAIKVPLADLEELALGAVRGVDAVHQHPAAVGPDQADQGLEEHGLAGAGRAEHHRHLAGRE